MRAPRSTRAGKASVPVAASSRPPAVPPPIERAVKTSERVAAALVADIVSEKLRPGDRLPNEAAMVERFGVGRSSLREALRILEVHGLINLRSGPGGGPVIVAVHPRDVARTFSLYLHLSGASIQELVDARLLLEPVIVRQAAERRDPGDLARLREALDVEAAIPPGDPRYLHAAENFHHVLATMTGNRVIDLLATSLKDLYTTRVVQGGLAGALAQADLHREHREVANAILRGHAAAAERLARAHTERQLVRLRKLPGLVASTINWG